jgi:sugar/nucleoside kinase (ribokinase family)
VTHVVSVGDLMVDVVARLPGPLAVGSDAPAPITLSGGGAAANVAAWASADGATATFLGRVGDDAFGRHAVDDLLAAGVDVRVTTDRARSTGMCIVLVDPSGERSMIPSAGANDGAYDVAALPGQADWLSMSGYGLFRDGSRATARDLLAAAREREWSIAVDAASAAPLAAVGAEAFLTWLGGDVLLLANSDEARVLTGLTDPAAAAHALAERLGEAVVKCGAEGAVWSDGTALHKVAATPASVVDTTGAGDAFAAGFLAAVGAGPDRLAAAARLAARAVAQVGGRPSRT